MQGWPAMRGDWSKDLNLRFSGSRDSQILKILRFSRDCADNFLAACTSSNFILPGHNTSCSRNDNWMNVRVQIMLKRLGELAARRRYMYIFVFRSTFKLMFKFNLITIEWIGGCMLVAARVRGLAGDISQVFVFRSTFKALPHQPPSDATPKIHCCTFWCKSLCWNAGTQFVCDRTTELPIFWMC